MLFLSECIVYEYKETAMRLFNLHFICLMKKQGTITKQEVPKILQSHLPEYKADKVKMEATFGMTNETYKITVEGQHPVIFRILSPMIDRKFENKVLEKLDAKKICPKMLFSCEEYRIEQYIQGAKHPSTQDINNDDKLLENILKTAYQLHQVKLPNDLKKKFFNDVVFTEESKAKYMKATCSEEGKQKQYNELKQNLMKEFDKLKEETKQQFTKGKHPVRLCHNDINNNNIFVKQVNGEQDILFIDFEYACLNYVAYDIANLMNECCFDYNDEEGPGFKVYKKVTEEEIKKVCSLYPGKYKGMQEDIKIMLKMANFFWALWSLIVEKNGNENFSPTEHGIGRWQLYKYYDSKYDK